VAGSLTPADPLASVPPPGGRRLAVRLRPAAQRAVRGGHPWVFDRSITHCTPGGQAGDLAVIFDHQRRFLAVGLYDPASPLRVRVLARGAPQAVDGEFLYRRLRAAVALRRSLDTPRTTAFRLVHGENDGLPGLVLDRYEATLVLKLYTPAWVPWLPALRAALAEALPHERLVLRFDRRSAARPELLHGLHDGDTVVGAPPPGAVPFYENGLRFQADVVRGHKTGFFLDQRDNRARVEAVAAGRRVLDVFAYTGGFALYAARGGAAAVSVVDGSLPALATCRRHFALNHDWPGVAAVVPDVRQGDAFAALAELAARGAVYDLVVVDPPAMAKRQAEVTTALRAYARLTSLALGVLAPGGTLVMASCSSRLSPDALASAVLRAAARAGRRLRETARTGHPLDHPVAFPEGAYLCCLFASES